LQNAIAGANKGTTPYESILLIPSVAQSPSAEALRASFKQLYQRQADLSTVQQIYTDKYPVVQEIKEAIHTLQTQTIPQQASGLLTQLKGRETEYETRIGSASQDLQQIPTRTI